MKKWYGVLNSYYDNGKVIANIMEVKEQEEKPEDTYTGTRRCDIYMNWFGTEEEATQFIEDCKRA